MKKTFSMILALTLCFALAIPAMAEGLAIAGDGYELSTDRAVKSTTDDSGCDAYFISDGTVFTLSSTGTHYKIGARIFVPVGDEKVEYTLNMTNGQFEKSPDDIPDDEWDAYLEKITLPANKSIKFSVPFNQFPDVASVELYIDFAGGDDGGMSIFILKLDTEASNNTKPVEPAPAAKPVVQPTSQKLTVNGEAKNTEIYNIDGSNYFKLRDMAALLNGTTSQFSVGYNEATKTISITTGEAYTPVGGELATGTDNSASAVASAQSIEINGQKVDLTAYNIGGYNFFKLRELGIALGFDVDYDTATATMTVTSK